MVIGYLNVKIVKMVLLRLYLSKKEKRVLPCGSTLFKTSKVAGLRPAHHFTLLYTTKEYAEKGARSPCPSGLLHSTALCSEEKNSPSAQTFFFEFLQSSVSFRLRHTGEGHSKIQSKPLIHLGELLKLAPFGSVPIYLKSSLIISPGCVGEISRFIVFDIVIILLL